MNINQQLINNYIWVDVAAFYKQKLDHLTPQPVWGVSSLGDPINIVSRNASLPTCTGEVDSVCKYQRARYCNKPSTLLLLCEGN